jgi:hypothetical protein
LSAASNKKINELSCELHNVTARDRDSFSSFDSHDSPHKNGKPFLLLEEKL